MKVLFEKITFRKRRGCRVFKKEKTIIIGRKGIWPTRNIMRPKKKGEEISPHRNKKLRKVSSNIKQKQPKVVSTKSRKAQLK